MNEHFFPTGMDSPAKSSTAFVAVKPTRRQKEIECPHPTLRLVMNTRYGAGDRTRICTAMPEDPKDDVTLVKVSDFLLFISYIRLLDHNRPCVTHRCGDAIFRTLSRVPCEPFFSLCFIPTRVMLSAVIPNCFSNSPAGAD